MEKLGHDMEKLGLDDSSLSDQKQANYQVQEEAASQQAPHYPGNITLIGVSGGQQQAPIDHWRYVPDATLQNSGLQQTPAQAIQQQHPQSQQQPQQNMLISSQISVPIIPPPLTIEASMHKEALQQLLQVLKSPRTPEQQQQILHILKSNPQLMAAFIKQRQVSLQLAAQQQGQAGAGDQQQLQHLMSPQ